MTVTHDRSVAPAIDLAALYQDLHRHPELAFAEHRTAEVLAGELRRSGFAVRTRIGGTGVVGVLTRGHGPVIMMRAELDALPLAEQTGARFAADPQSTGPTMHACGHDLHVAWLVGAARQLAVRDDWQGTIIALGQPAEETGQGARAMINDGLFDLVPVPDVLLAQHVGPAPVGSYASVSGPLLAGSDTVDVRFTALQLRDRLADAADPARLAAGFVARLPDRSSRLVGWPDATVAVLAINAGDPARRQLITPDTATVRLVLRSPTAADRDRARLMVERLAKAETEARAHEASAPNFTWHSAIPPVINDPALAEQVMAAVGRELGERAVQSIPPGPSSDDFSRLVSAVDRPAVYSYVGGGDPVIWRQAMLTGDRSKIIANHSPRFLPASGALEVGIRTWTRTLLELASTR